MASTRGRQVVVPLTNKSGGAVAAGDVVVVDTANNASFTTTTSSGATASIGVAQEAIASNATGRVLVSGYAALVNVNASVTRGNYGTTHTVAKQATDAGSARTTGTFCQFLTGGTTPDAIVYPVDLAGVALTNPMTTAGDTIYGGASGVPTRLAGGTSGYVLTSNGATSAPSWQAGGGSIPLGQPSGTLLRTYTFDTTVESWTTDNGTLTSTGSRLRLVGSSNSSALEPSGAANVADGEVQMDTYHVSGTGGGVIIRATDANNYYGVFYGLINDGGDQGVLIYKRVSGSFTNLSNSGAVGIQIGKIVAGTLHFKVLVRFVGSQIDVYVNEAHKVSVTDTTYTTGRIGIRTAASTTFEADNVKVYSVP